MRAETGAEKRREGFHGKGAADGGGKGRQQELGLGERRMGRITKRGEGLEGSRRVGRRGRGAECWGDGRAPRTSHIGMSR